MSRRIDLVTDFDGLSVVWVDDRVLLTDEDVQTITNSVWGKAQNVTKPELVSINRVWADAVQNNAVDDLEEVSQSFALAAIALKQVCMELRCNLSLVDFSTAHKECFSQTKTLFLLDLQNLTKPLGFTHVDTTEIDRDWNWELYGAQCVLYYALNKSCYRFLSRFRSDKAPAVSNLLPKHFNDYEEVEKWSLKHDLPKPLALKFKDFVRMNLIHEDPELTELLLWSVNLPLNGKTDHQELGQGQALARIRTCFGVGFDSDSAKSLFLSDVSGTCQPTPDYPLRAADLSSIFAALDLKNVNLLGIAGSDCVRLPCQPGLPFALSLKALIHEMKKCPRYYPPKQIQISRILTSSGEYDYTLTLLLESKDQNNAEVVIDDLKNAYNNWVTDGRRPRLRHLTIPRIGDLEFCRIALTGASILGGKEKVVSGTLNAALTVSFGDQSTPSIKFNWKGKKS